MLLSSTPQDDEGERPAAAREEVVLNGQCWKCGSEVTMDGQAGRGACALSLGSPLAQAAAAGLYASVGIKRVAPAACRVQLSF